MLRARFRKDTIKLVQIRKEIIHVDRDPFHDIDILGQHDYRLEIALYKCAVDEWTTQVEWFLFAAILVAATIARCRWGGWL